MSYYTQGNHYELLEISQRASPSEIEAAYKQQIDLVSGNSMATYGLFVGDDLNVVQEHLEEAYKVLSDPVQRRAYDLEHFDHSYVTPPVTTDDAAPDASADGAEEASVATHSEVAPEADTKPAADEQTQKPVASPVAASVANEAPAKEPVSSTAAPSTPVVAEKPAPPVTPTAAPSGAVAAAQQRSDNVGKPSTKVLPPTPDDQKVELSSCTGESFRAVREARGITLESISARTKIAEYYLHDIEAERYTTLPPGLYLRSYLKQFAASIGVANAEQAASEYLERMKQNLE